MPLANSQRKAEAIKKSKKQAMTKVPWWDCLNKYTNQYIFIGATTRMDDQIHKHMALRLQRLIFYS